MESGEGRNEGRLRGVEAIFGRREGIRRDEEARRALDRLPSELNIILGG
jgi:hypothetical protein